MKDLSGKERKLVEHDHQHMLFPCFPGSANSNQMLYSIPSPSGFDLNTGIHRGTKDRELESNRYAMFYRSKVQIGNCLIKQILDSYQYISDISRCF